ncbi:probable RNA-directed DNA polymerase from transposon BS [Caerostris darwini]|uniref:Probable RNA-directed DNA polymerase from transposon BS n=1 Tax=Caerostris darwini TaxID=1538125 RepID=A0AAV4S880_9ARAC|nr:probable RNA-directed DNA polymerase from transposon BS [Caerostris darwini]
MSRLRIDRINSPRKNLESQGITVLSRKHRNNINIFNLYHPPNNQKLDLDALEGLFTNATVLLGDLNAKHTAWGCALANNRGQDLENFSNDKAFLFLNNGTHTYRSHSYNTLTTNKYLDTYANDDICGPEKNLNEQLQKNPITEDLENEWLVFKHSIFTAAERAVPRGKHKKTRPAFTNDSQDLQKLLAKREHLLQSHNLNDNTDARIELKINAEIKREYCSIKQSNWQDLCKSLDYKTPYTRLWRLAKKLDTIQPQVENTNSIIGINVTPTANEKEAADALGNYYAEESKLALGRENKKSGRAARKLIRSCRVPASNELFNDPITSSELLYDIQQLDFKKSPGPDGIHGQFIVNLGSCAIKRLLHIFNLSWKLGRLPRQWKTAIVVPIRKPNKDASCMGSYRPITLTCMTCKLIERIILRRITFHLMNRNMLPQEQYGFRKGHSTIDQILYFVQRVKDAHNMKPSRHTMAVFLDLTKAFDKLNYEYI